MSKDKLKREISLLKQQLGEDTYNELRDYDYIKELIEGGTGSEKGYLSNKINELETSLKSLESKKDFKELSKINKNLIRTIYNVKKDQKDAKQEVYLFSREERQFNSVGISKLEEYEYNKSYERFSVNLKRPFSRFNTNSIYRINAFYFDLDFKDFEGISEDRLNKLDMTLKKLDLKNYILIKTSKKGLHLLILTEKYVGKVTNLKQRNYVIKMYKTIWTSINKELCDALNMSFDITNDLVRYTKFIDDSSGTELLQMTDERYDFDDLYSKFNTEIRGEIQTDAVVKKEQRLVLKRKSNHYVKKTTNKRLNGNTADDRLNDLILLIKLRNGSIDKHKMVFYCNVLNQNRLDEMNALFDESYTEEELYNRKRWFDRLNNQTKIIKKDNAKVKVSYNQYHYPKTSTLIEEYNITEEEQLQMRMTKTDKVRAIHQKAKVLKEKFIKGRKELVKELEARYVKLSKDKTNYALAKELEIDKSTIKQREGVTVKEINESIKEYNELLKELTEFIDKTGIIVEGYLIKEMKDAIGTLETKNKKNILLAKKRLDKSNKRAFS